MNPAMYTFLNKELGMSVGKATAQGEHAAVQAFRLSDPKMIEAWDVGLHYTKLVMEANSTLRLWTIQAYLERRGFKTELIIDEGRTEIEPFSVTALGVEIVDRDDPHVKATFSGFKTYRDKPEPETPKRKWLPWSRNLGV